VSKPLPLKASNFHKPESGLVSLGATGSLSAVAKGV
jgi:hypothetical protein